ncbi:AfsR/SARP family transcriptional regulator [Streptomyces sp. NPDC050504]|uniref:AfsR/SARP family transcriptional regulator n=1 Tax=Streptomyces sp. NPDC050504 TaxID=3365618 RepID=UPI0037BC84ED
MRYRYDVLGTTTVHRPDGTPVPVGGARLRALLTVLALRPGRAVRTGVLVAEVWGAGEPPADEVGALQALVGRLRRALGKDAVLSDESGYRLDAGPDDVDVHRFDRLAREGAAAVAGGEAAGGLALLDGALALWRGPALADLPDRATEAARWDARRLDAVRARLEALVALGRAREALPELVALCAEHPLDEPLQALRLRTLRGAGRGAEALTAYEEVRRDLAARLGADPGPQLRALHAELLEGGEDEPNGPGGADPLGARGTAREWGTRRAHPPTPSGPATPRTHSPREAALATGGFSGRGGEGTAPRATVPPGNGTPYGTVHPAAQGNLPARLTSFVGREVELDALRTDLARTRLVTLLGPGGAGKTRLSQEAATAAAPTCPDGVWFAELAPVTDPGTVPEAVLTALGARETVLRGAGAEELRAAEGHADDPVARLVEHCARRDMLLVLDNCEHVIGAAADLAQTLLTRCPGLRVLATSREPLGVPGESVRPVGPLPTPAALRLLAERGAAANPASAGTGSETSTGTGTGTDTHSDPEAAAEICRRLDGLPLAIELAAARLRHLTLRQIADRLDDRFRLLTSGSRTVLPRQQTLRAVVDWSWELLDADERRALAALSVFAGGCDLAAAEAVTGPFALDHLSSLVDKSLLVAAPAPDGTGMRYRMLETIHEYAAEHLDASGDRPGAERRHLTHYRELARTTDPLLRGPGQQAAIALLTAEYDNLRTALRRAVAAREEQEALCLVHALTWYWQLRDLRTEARQWAQAASSLGPDPFAGPAVPALPVLDRCTDAPPPMAPDVLQEARRGAALIALAGMEHEGDEWLSEEGRARLRVIVDTYRPGLPQACRAPGSLWLYAVLLSGDVQHLREVLDAAVATCRELGYEWELGTALHTRANILAGSPESAAEAGAAADESLEIFRRLGDEWGVAEALSARGEARENKGDFEAAAADFLAAVEYAERFGAQGQVELLRARYAMSMGELGHDEEAETVLRGVLARRRSGHQALPMARMSLIVLLGTTGRTGEAREQVAELEKEFRPDMLHLFRGILAGAHAWLECQDGQYAAGLARVREALERAVEPMSMLVAPQMPALHLGVAARVLAGLGGAGDVRDAARMLGLQEVLLPAGHVPRLMERHDGDDAEKTARAALGDAAFERAHAEGRGLTVADAIALLDGRAH